MKITKIEKEKRLYTLELDNTENLYITEDTIVHFMLSKGMIVNAEKLENIKKFAQLSYGKNLGLYYISFSSREPRKKLLNIFNNMILILKLFHKLLII